MNHVELVKLSPALRKRASLHIWERKSQCFDMKKMFERINEKLTTPSEDVFKDLKKIDLTEFVLESPGLDKTFTCSFFVKRFAWVSKNENGEYRYYSKIKSNDTLYSFDLFDLLSILLNKSSKETVQFIEETWSIQSMNKWIENQKTKYNANQEKTKMIPLENYPELTRAIAGHWHILRALYDFGLSKVSGGYFSQNNESIFFISTSFFKTEFFPNHSVSTLNKFINLFAVLGLIKKVKDIPLALRIEAEKWQALRHRNNTVSYYAVPLLDETLLCEAEKRAKVLNDEKLSYYQVNKEHVKTLFGEEIYDSVYVQKTHGRKKEEIKDLNEQSNYREIKDAFYKEMFEQGFCVKETLKKKLKISTKEFNDSWKKIIEISNAELIMPTSVQLSDYGLSKRTLLAKLPKETQQKYRQYQLKPLSVSEKMSLI